jgi:hypothetical protein
MRQCAREARIVQPNHVIDDVLKSVLHLPEAAHRLGGTAFVLNIVRRFLP